MDIARLLSTVTGGQGAMCERQGWTTRQSAHRLTGETVASAPAEAGDWALRSDSVSVIDLAGCPL